MKESRKKNTKLTAKISEGDELLINQTMKFSFVQQKFNELFPYLKIEFYKGNPKRPINTDLILGELHPYKLKGSVLINETCRVKDLEVSFYEAFKVAVKILRKSGESWLETRLTGDWSLCQQNNQGKEICVFVKH
jgi:hypothetical protein